MYVVALAYFFPILILAVRLTIALILIMVQGRDGGRYENLGGGGERVVFGGHNLLPWLR